MPCNSDYMEASGFEINLSRVLCLLDEVQAGRPIKSDYWRGYHPKAYNGNHDKKVLDDKVAKLCALLQGQDVTKYSLELQMWWRDHQKADAERKESEAAKAKKKQLRKEALAKLTVEEKEALGIE